MTNSVQLPVQLPYSYVQLPCSPLPCLPLGELHACTRAARSPIGIGSSWLSSLSLAVDIRRRWNTIGRKWLPGLAARVTERVFVPLPCLASHRGTKRIQRLPDGIAGLSGYQNRSLMQPKSFALKAIRHCHIGTSASRQRQSIEGLHPRALSRPLALWEGKTRESLGEWQALRQPRSSPSNRFDPENLEIEGGTPLFAARRIFDLPNPYAAARWPFFDAIHFGGAADE
jgi:hypothetical protein